MKLVSPLFRKPGLLIITVDLVTNIHCCLLAHHLLHLDLEHDQELAEQSSPCCLLVSSCSPLIRPWQGSKIEDVIILLPVVVV